MKWYVIPSVILCGLNCVFATLILGLASFHLYTDKSTNAPIPPNEEWIVRVTGLIPFASAWMMISLFGIFTSMARKRIWLASLTLFLEVICFGTATYFTLAFGAQLGMEDMPAETLFNITMSKIALEKKDSWIPGWLDNIQKQSKQCCGIITYRDYEQFWPDASTHIPRSCCRDTKDIPSPCPNDLTQIPFPNTPAIFFKVETGCMFEINESVRNHIEETFKNCITMSIFIGLSVIAYLLLYVKRYLVNTPTDSRRKFHFVDAGPGGDADAEGASGEPAQATSSEEQGPAPLDSLEGVPPIPLTSIDSIPQYQALPPPSSSPVVNETNLYKDVKDTSQYPSYPAAASSSSPPQKAINSSGGSQTVKQPEAATGEEMTIAAASIGRYEVFVAQDVQPIDTLGIPGRGGLLQPSMSIDDMMDSARGEENVVSTPPGSPGGRRKKVRKAGMPHHHRNHHHHQQ